MTSRRFPTTSRGLGALGLVAAMTVVAAALAAVALAGQATTPQVVGNPKAGKVVFVANCSACHRLKAAASVGTIGPRLDGLKLSEATLVKAVANGGASVMTKAALAKYATQMVAYKGVLSTKQIQNVAAFVYAANHS